MGLFGGNGRVAAAVVIAAVAGAYVAASMIGRSGDPSGDPPAGTVPSASPTPARSGPASPVPGSGADPLQTPTAELSGPAGSPEPDFHPAAVPGVPPLPRSAAGPYGSRRTTGAPYVALTFDDGPDPRYTPQVLELLRRSGVTATFCVVGELVEAYPELVRAIAADGHTLCNHSWDHDMALGSRSRAEIRAELKRTNAAIRRAAPGTWVSYFRQPGGNWTARVVDVAEELGMTSLHWAVDPQDWRRSSRAGTIAAEVTSATEQGAIVLLHDGGGERSGTVRAVRAILRELSGRMELAALPTPEITIRGGTVTLRLQ